MLDSHGGNRPISRSGSNSDSSSTKSSTAPYVSYARYDRKSLLHTWRIPILCYIFALLADCGDSSLYTMRGDVR